MVDGALPTVVPAGVEPLWFLGTLTRIRLDGAQTGGRLGVFEGVFPRGAAPPLHSHPQDETFYVLDGDVTAWLVAQDVPADWVEQNAQQCRPGAMAFAPAGTPHTFRVDSETARMLFLSTPAGIEEYVRALAEPAEWPWLPAPADGPRVAPERISEVERELGIVRHGPPPPAA
jgi:quercetin dioxygenase-like cupin family protein